MGGNAKYRAAKKTKRHMDENNAPPHQSRFEKRVAEIKATHKYNTEFSRKVRDAKNIQELQEAMFYKYGKSDNEFEYYAILSKNQEMIKRALVTVDELEEQYPFMQGNIKEFGKDDNSLASYISGKLYFGNAWDTEDDIRLYSGNKRLRHPPNSTPESTIAHEFAHAMEDRIMQKVFSGIYTGDIHSVAPSDFGKIIDAWDSNEFMRPVQEKALRRLQMTEKEAYSNISGYVTEKGIKEVFSESFADVYSNGDNASEVSKVFVDELIKAAR